MGNGWDSKLLNLLDILTTVGVFRRNKPMLSISSFVNPESLGISKGSASSFGFVVIIVSFSFTAAG